MKINETAQIEGHLVESEIESNVFGPCQQRHEITALNVSEPITWIYYNCLDLVATRVTDLVCSGQKRRFRHSMSLKPLRKHSGHRTTVAGGKRVLRRLASPMIHPMVLRCHHRHRYRTIVRHALASIVLHCILWNFLTFVELPFRLSIESFLHARESSPRAWIVSMPFKRHMIPCLFERIRSRTDSLRACYRHQVGVLSCNWSPMAERR